MNTRVIVTDHAYQRARERMSWSAKVIDKMAQLAYDNGIKHNDTKGTLNKYISKCWFKNRDINNVRVYGENIYLFNNNRLITIYQLPKILKKGYTANQRRRATQ